MEAQTDRTGGSFPADGGSAGSVRRDGVITRVVRQAIGTEAITAGVTDQLSSELRMALGQLREAMEQRSAALEQRLGVMEAALGDAVKRSVATEVQAAIEGAEGRLRHTLEGETRGGIGAMDTHLTEHLSALVGGEIQGQMRGMVAEAFEQNVGRRDTELAQHLINHLDARTADLQARSEEELRAAVDRGLGHHAELLRAELTGALAAERTALAQEVHRQMHHVDSHLSAHLTKELALQLGAPHGPASNQHVTQQRLLALGRLLQPVTARGVGKCRVGRMGDGGYVMLDDLDRAPFALSLGVGDEMTWDLEMAGRGVEVHQFDYTIAAPPETHERIVFHRSRIAPVAGGGDHSFASAQALGGNRPCIIKMDIEGDEWAVLDATTPDDFTQVAQLVIELHDFDRAGDTAWYDRAEQVLRNLSKNFCVVHLHANNNGLYRSTGNIAFPEILEVTFANRRFYEFDASMEVFPTGLDAPNREDLPEIILGAFRF